MFLILKQEIISITLDAVATVAAIENIGAIPVLVDVDNEFYNIDPSKLEEVIGPNTKAVIAVHLYGQSCDLDSIASICSKHNLFLIEDVSQAHGATWKGKKLGSIGDVGCFSCYPTKNLGAIGDAGLITTKHPEIQKKIKMLREYGWSERYLSKIPGRNSRLDEIQAAILRIKLKHLDDDNNKRKVVASHYDKAFRDVFSVPEVRMGADHVYHLYVLRVAARDELKSKLYESGVVTGIHYPVPIHLQDAYKLRIRCSKSMVVTESLAKEVISLPIYPEISSQDISRVIDSVIKA